MFKTPILFLIFNRFDTANQVFQKIKEQKPKYLYIAADWPRKDKKWEAEKCKKTREEILKQIDWDCELKTLFREDNLWCKMAISWAITRFFENEEQWIILEDDCLPDPSFFWFCETLLNKYKEDKRIMMISWDCFLPEKWQKNNEYAFSYCNHIRWWATWRRAWELCDISMEDLPEFVKQNMIKHITNDFFSKKNTLRELNDVYEWRINSWAYPWTFSIRKNWAFSVFPLVNLISNIWFSPDALHTKNDFWYWNLKTFKIDYKNLKEPKNMIINEKYQRYDEKHVQLSFMRYVASILRKLWISKIIARILWYNA